METIIADVIAIIEEGRQKAYRAVNTSMVEAYWLTGKRIVEEEQHGQERATYGKEVVKFSFVLLDLSKPESNSADSVC